jgi:hypothetical protein
MIVWRVFFTRTGFHLALRIWQNSISPSAARRFAPLKALIFTDVRKIALLFDLTQRPPRWTRA